MHNTEFKNDAPSCLSLFTYLSMKERLLMGSSALHSIISFLQNRFYHLVTYFYKTLSNLHHITLFCYSIPSSSNFWFSEFCFFSSAFIVLSSGLINLFHSFKTKSFLSVVFCVLFNLQFNHVICHNHN